MNVMIYRRYMLQVIREALENSDRTNSGIAEYLRSLKVSGLLVRNKTEKRRAIADATTAFDDHSHWPLEIILSHLGFNPEDVQDLESA